jgi:hypothetical protein
MQVIQSCFIWPRWCAPSSLALMQIQVNALLLLLELHSPGVPVKEDFQQISEGV